MNRAYAILLLVLTALFPSFASAQEPTPTLETMSYDELASAISRAKRLLRDAHIGTTEVGGRNAVLAVWDPTLGERDLRLVHVRGGVAQTPGYRVEVRMSNGMPMKPDVDPYNGVNTRYAVLEPASATVLAIKTNTGTRPGAIYVPYNPAYQTTAVVAEGKRYVEALIRDAQKRIKANRVRSIARPGKLASQAIDDAMTDDDALDADARLVMTLIADEHIDKDEYVLRGADWTTGKVFAVLALNRGDGYFFSVSSAGAGGIGQFMVDTFVNVHVRYPAANLLPPDADPIIARIASLRSSLATAKDLAKHGRTKAIRTKAKRDVVVLTARVESAKKTLEPYAFAGMRDHETAVTAMFCLVDRMLAFMIERKIAVPKDRILLGTYLAASYNAGEHRGLPWYTQHVRMCVNRRRACRFSHGLPEETQTYTKKFGLIYEYLFG